MSWHEIGYSRFEVRCKDYEPEIVTRCVRYPEAKQYSQITYGPSCGPHTSAFSNLVNSKHQGIFLLKRSSLAIGVK